MLVAGLELRPEEEDHLRNRALAWSVISARSAPGGHRGSLLCGLCEVDGQPSVAVTSTRGTVLGWYRIVRHGARVDLRRVDLADAPACFLPCDLRGVLAQGAELRALSRTLVTHSAAMRARSAALQLRSGQSQQRRPRPDDPEPGGAEGS